MLCYAPQCIQKHHVLVFALRLRNNTILFTPPSHVKNKIKDKYFRIYVFTRHQLASLLLKFYIFSTEQYIGILTEINMLNKHWETLSVFICFYILLIPSIYNLNPPSNIVSLVILTNPQNIHWFCFISDIFLPLIPNCTTQLLLSVAILLDLIIE